MGPECPDCGTRLKRGVCPECGWKERGAVKGAVDPNAGRCGWEEQGRRCLQRGVYTENVQGAGQRLCSWHAEARRNPKEATRERFDRFIDFLRDGLYCTVWTHFDRDVLWGTVFGEETSAKPEPCRNPACSVRLDMERELGYLLPDPPQPPRQPLVQLLGRRLAVKPETGERTAEERARLEAERERQLTELRRRDGG